MRLSLLTHSGIDDCEVRVMLLNLSRIVSSELKRRQSSDNCCKTIVARQLLQRIEKVNKHMKF
jgi:hypothetical protein